MLNKSRNPWIAGTITIFAIGLGHVYCGGAKKGILLYLVGLLFFPLMSFSLLVYAPIGPILVIVASLAFITYCVIDSVKLAKIYNVYYTMKKYNKCYIYILYFICASFIIQPIVDMIVKRNIAEAYKIPSAAMRETLQVGDYIVAEKYGFKAYKPSRGDIIIFAYPADESKDFIKRIIALGGETIEVIDKVVLIDGEPLDEPYIYFSVPTNRKNYGPTKVPDDSLFVMGDNRDHSSDSRSWGFLKLSKVKGKAKNIYWSWDKAACEVRWGRIGQRIAQKTER